MAAAASRRGRFDDDGHQREEGALEGPARCRQRARSSAPESIARSGSRPSWKELPRRTVAAAALVGCCCSIFNCGLRADGASETSAHKLTRRARQPRCSHLGRFGPSRPLGEGADQCAEVEPKRKVKDTLVCSRLPHP